MRIQTMSVKIPKGPPNLGGFPNSQKVLIWDIIGHGSLVLEVYIITPKPLTLNPTNPKYQPQVLFVFQEETKSKKQVRQC